MKSKKLATLGLIATLSLANFANASVFENMAGAVAGGIIGVTVGNVISNGIYHAAGRPRYYEKEVWVRTYRHHHLVMHRQIWRCNHHGRCWRVD